MALLKCLQSGENVTPREGRVSRNDGAIQKAVKEVVTPREGRVSRNNSRSILFTFGLRHAPRGACE